MSAGFTPGPWVADRSCVRNAGEPHRFTCGLTRTAYADQAEMHANARLIAAAPQLYEALERVVAHAISYGDFEGSGAHTAALAALAQARGDLVDPSGQVKL